MASESKNKFSTPKLAAVIYLPTFQLLLWLLPSSPFDSSASRVFPALFFSALISIAIALACTVSWNSEGSPVQHEQMPATFHATIMGVQWLPSVPPQNCSTEAQPFNILDLLPLQAGTNNFAGNAVSIETTGVATGRNSESHVEYVTAGMPISAFVSLETALIYLYQQPDKCAWVMNWDADRPVEKQSEKNLVLLILGGPQYQSQNAPLARLYRAAFANYSKPEQAIEAWKATLHLATNHAEKTPADIEYLIHDGIQLHRGDLLAQAIVTEQPGFDFKTQSFTTRSLPAKTGAGTALLGVALGIAYAHNMGKLVMVASTHESEQTVATVITPAAPTTPGIPDTGSAAAEPQDSCYHEKACT